MAEKSSGQSDHLHCVNCAKLKEASCAEIKKSLDECSQAHEDARLEKEQAVQKELKEAKNKISKLQKTLSAFQLATTVGVTILGQGAFDKIFSKVEEVQKVQAKIADIAPPSKDKDEKPSNLPKEPKKTTSNFRKTNSKNDLANLLKQFTDLDKISQAKIEITKSGTQSGPWIPTESAAASTKTISQLIVDPPVVPPITVANTTKYDFPMFNTIPDAVLPIQYTLLDFQDSPFTYGQGYEISSVPTPNSLSVFALSLINTPKRRMA